MPASLTKAGARRIQVLGKTPRNRGGRCWARPRASPGLADPRRARVVGPVDEPAAETRAAREAVDPAHEVVRVALLALEDLDHLGQRARGEGLDQERPPGTRFSRSVMRVKQPSIPKPPIAAWNRSGRARASIDELARGREQRDELDVLADRAHGEVVLAVDVHGDAAAEGRVHRPGHDRRPPAVRERVLPEVAGSSRPARASRRRSRGRSEDAVHARDVEHDAARVEGRVAVAAAGAAEADRAALLARAREGRAHVVDAGEPGRTPLRRHGEAPSEDLPAFPPRRPDGLPIAARASDIQPPEDERRNAADHERDESPALGHVEGLPPRVGAREDELGAPLRA